MITVYAKREPTTDPILNDPTADLMLNHPKGKQDVQIYRDRECKTPFVRFLWWQKSKPDRRYRYITLNCYKWRLRWI